MWCPLSVSTGSRSCDGVTGREKRRGSLLSECYINPEELGILMEDAGGECKHP